MTPRRAAGSGFTVVPVALAQRQIGDWVDLAARRHAMHALLELDITDKVLRGLLGDEDRATTAIGERG